MNLKLIAKLYNKKDYVPLRIDIYINEIELGVQE